MFKAILAAAAFLLIAPVQPAFAVDLDSLSASDRRVYCYVYVAVDLEMRERAGLVDRGEAMRQRNKMSGAIYRREGSLSSGRYESRMRRAFIVIARDDPRGETIAAQATVCRALFRL